MTEIISDFVQVSHDGTDLELFYAYPESSTPLPTVIIFPHWAGRDQFCRDKATSLAKMGYVGIALDLYGHGKVGRSVAENSALMEPLINDREFLKHRIIAIMDHLKEDPRVNSLKIAAIGYCFGGLCALDAVRNNVGLKGAVSVHGLFNPPSYPLPDTYSAKVLALHGYKDPMVNANQVEALQIELSHAKVDFQLMTYGRGYHAFTNSDAHDYQLGTVYDSLLAHRARLMMNDFLQEIFLHP